MTGVINLVLQPYKNIYIAITFSGLVKFQRGVTPEGSSDCKHIAKSALTYPKLFDEGQQFTPKSETQRPV